MRKIRVLIAFMMLMFVFTTISYGDLEDIERINVSDIKNEVSIETSKTVEISYYGKGAIIEAGKSFDISSERIGDFITVRSEDGEVSIFRGFDSRTVTEIGNLKASTGKLPMEVIIHN